MSDNNYPILFENINDAESWANSVVLSIMKQIDEQRSSEIIVETSKKEYIQLRSEIKQAHSIIINIEELKQKSHFENEKKKAIEHKNKIGIFDIKGKIFLKKQIEELNQKIQAVSKIISEKEAKNNEIIKNNNLRLQEIQSIAYGYTGNILIENNYNSYLYRIEPTPIIENVSNQFSDVPPINKSPESIVKEKNDINFSINNPCFCRKCGFKLLLDSDFCSKCGTKIERENLWVT